MKKYSQFQKIVATLMSFILLLELTGCYTKRVLTTSELTHSDQFLIHYNTTIYTAYDLEVNNGVLTGKFDFNNMDFTNPKFIHLYLSTDSLFTITNDQFTVPVTSIKEINQKIRDQQKTKTLTIVLIAAASIGLVAGLSCVLINSLRTPSPPEPDTDWCTYLQSIEACSDGSPN